MALKPAVADSSAPHWQLGIDQSHSQICNLYIWDHIQEYATATWHCICLILLLSDTITFCLFCAFLSLPKSVVPEQTYKWPLLFNKNQAYILQWMQMFKPVFWKNIVSEYAVSCSLLSSFITDASVEVPRHLNWPWMLLGNLLRFAESLAVLPSCLFVSMTIKLLCNHPGHPMKCYGWWVAVRVPGGIVAKPLRALTDNVSVNVLLNHFWGNQCNFLITTVNVWPSISGCFAGKTPQPTPQHSRTHFYNGNFRTLRIRLLIWSAYPLHIKAYLLSICTSSIFPFMEREGNVSTFRYF